jgi:predicted N-acyltransferase
MGMYLATENQYFYYSPGFQGFEDFFRLSQTQPRTFMRLYSEVAVTTTIKAFIGRN